MFVYKLRVCGFESRCSFSPIDLEDATFEDLLKRDECRSIHENNIHILLIKIYKSIDNIPLAQRIQDYI